jgi:energy-coupling factor transporter ATP-binding protein EcfA2
MKLALYERQVDDAPQHTYPSFPLRLNQLDEALHRQHGFHRLELSHLMAKFSTKLLKVVKTTFRWFRGRCQQPGSIDIGPRVVDGAATRRRVVLSPAERTTHIVLLGKSGSGKSSALKRMAQLDIEADRGFVYFDLHGDATPFLLRTLSARERKLRRHLSDKLVVVAPGDPELSVGINPLEQVSSDFTGIAEFAETLRHRWHLSHFGARTDELLRNALFSLSTNGLTLLELVPFLTHTGFRASCLKRVTNPEVREYFELRYNQTTEAMRAVMREPILNKISAFTADPHFRHIVGQERSTLSFKQAMDDGQWIIVNLEKGRLGEQALTLGSLIFAMIKHAVFAREKRSLYTIYCDEMQNLVPYSRGGIETVLSEARKFGVGIVSANQFLDQHPPEMRAALLAVGTHLFFQLSSVDAGLIAQALDGGTSLAYQLKNLPQGHCIVKRGAERPVEVQVPNIHAPHVDYTDLINRSRYARGRVRAHIERDIKKRHELIHRKTDDILDAWA